MTALEEIKKPLEGKDIATLTNVELVTEISRLLSEVDRLRQFLFPYADRTDISGISWDGKYLIGDKASISAFHEMKNRGEQIDVYKRAYDQNEEALKARAEAAEAEVKRLQAEIDRKSSMPGDHRYWEGRYRDEAAENEKLRELLKPFATEAENWHDSVPDDYRTLCTEPNSKTAHPGSEADFTVGDLRRARTALTSTGGEHHAE